MLKDLRRNHGMCNSIEKVYLVDESKRITSPYFNVRVPSMMGSIEGSLENLDGNIDKATMLNDDTTDISDSISLAGCIRAKSIAPYRFKHEGWIPEYKIQTVTAETGSNEETSAGSTEGITEVAANHTHAIKKALKLMSNKLKSIIFNTLVVTNSTEVDYQELNRIYIKKGHALYGCFVSGGDSDEFVIIAIDDVIPYYDEDEDNNTNNQF